MLATLKQVVIGSPIESARQIHERLNKKTAMAVFSSDAMSSSAYATEEILRHLALAGLIGGMAFRYAAPIAGLIALLLTDRRVFVSPDDRRVSQRWRRVYRRHRQPGTVSWVDCRRCAADRLCADGRGVDFSGCGSTDLAVPMADALSRRYCCRRNRADHAREPARRARVWPNLCGSDLSLPGHDVIDDWRSASFGDWRAFRSRSSHLSDQSPVRANSILGPGSHFEPIGLFLLMASFASGCAALTGVEAISNGVPAFRTPEAKNARTTLVWMALLLLVMFVGITWLSGFGAEPRVEETLISQIGRGVFGDGSLLHSILQFATAGILLLAANTSFADFPRLTSLIARDRYLPRQFASLGDRLVFSNGILILAAFSVLLVIDLQRRGQ